MAALCLGLPFYSTPTWGTSFLTFDARSIAMGGAGVVTARSHNASLFNPALLIDTDPSRKTHLHSHAYAGVRLTDRDNFLEAANNFKDRYDKVPFKDLLANTINLTPSAATIGDLRAASAQIRTIQADIHTLSNKPLRASGSYGFAMSYPFGRWSWGAYHRQYLVLGSVVRVAPEDNAAIDRATGLADRAADLFEQVLELEDDVKTARDLTLADAVERTSRVAAAARALNIYLDFDRLQQDVQQRATGGKGLRHYLREPFPRDFLSTIDSQGADVTETGVSLARAFAGGRYLPGSLRVGVTLKQVDFTTISFSQRVNEFSLSAYEHSENRRSYQRPNLDLGLLYDLPGNFQTGLVLRNLVPYDLTTVDEHNVPLRPMARLGIGYIRRSLRLSLDVDLTRNEPLGFDPDKQYLSLGAEWFLWRNTAVRGGLRTNIVDGETLPSLGLGFGGNRGHIDLALARSFNGNEWAASFQAGMAF